MRKLSAAVNILLTQHGARGLVFAVGAVDLLVAPFLLHNKMKIIHYLPNDTVHKMTNKLSSTKQE